MADKFFACKDQHELHLVPVLSDIYYRIYSDDGKLSVSRSKTGFPISVIYTGNDGVDHIKALLEMDAIDVRYHSFIKNYLNGTFSTDFGIFGQQMPNELPDNV